MNTGPVLGVKDAGGTVDIRVTQVMTRMQEQLHTQLAMRDLAAGIGLSVSTLTRLFRQHTGKTPRLYLHDLRMARARLLVERTSLSVADVMTQVGISDPSHFARDFRTAHGYSPRTFRRQLRVGRDSRWFVSGPRCG